MYVVLPGSTLFRDLTRSALAQLSFPTSELLTATGMFYFMELFIILIDVGLRSCCGVIQLLIFVIKLAREYNVAVL